MKRNKYGRVQRVKNRTRKGRRNMIQHAYTHMRKQQQNKANPPPMTTHRTRMAEIRKETIRDIQNMATPTEINTTNTSTRQEPNPQAGENMKLWQKLNYMAINDTGPKRWQCEIGETRTHIINSQLGILRHIEKEHNQQRPPT